MWLAETIALVLMILHVDGLSVPAYDYVPGEACRDVQEALAYGVPLAIEIGGRDYKITRAECQQLKGSTV